MFGIQNPKTSLRTQKTGIPKNNLVNADQTAQPRGKIKQLMRSISKFIDKFKAAKPPKTPLTPEQKAAKHEAKEKAKKNIAYFATDDWMSFDLKSDDDLTKTPPLNKKHRQEAA